MGRIEMRAGWRFGGTIDCETAWFNMRRLKNKGYLIRMECCKKHDVSSIFGTKNQRSEGYMGARRSILCMYNMSHLLYHQHKDNLSDLRCSKNPEPSFEQGVCVLESASKEPLRLDFCLNEMNLTNNPGISCSISKPSGKSSNLH